MGDKLAPLLSKYLLSSGPRETILLAGECRATARETVATLRVIITWRNEDLIRHGLIKILLEVAEGLLAARMEHRRHQWTIEPREEESRMGLLNRASPKSDIQS